MKKLLIIAAVLAVCAGVWFICSREKVPAAAETQAAPAGEEGRAGGRRGGKKTPGEGGWGKAAGAGTRR